MSYRGAHPMHRDLLIILDDAAGADEIAARWRVRQRISQAVFTIEIAGAETRTEVAAIGAVRAVLASGDRVTDDMRRGLTNNEIIFVDAYTRRSPPAGYVVPHASPSA